MECKYCDEFTGICTNGDCPMCSEECPVPDIEGVCKFEDREEMVYKLTLKGCACAALMAAGLIDNTGDLRADAFWEDFENLMRNNGYIREESG